MERAEWTEGSKTAAVVQRAMMSSGSCGWTHMPGGSSSGWTKGVGKSATSGGDNESKTKKLRPQLLSMENLWGILSRRPCMEDHREGGMQGLGGQDGEGPLG